jgi:hypothetical protein
VATFQHSLPFLQSESFQIHVGTIHRRAIGPLAFRNGTSAYTPLTRHLPSPTIECLHRPPHKLTCSSHNFRYELSLPTSKESAAKYTRPTRPISRPDSQVRSKSLLYHHAISTVTYLFGLLRYYVNVTMPLSECNNAALSNCCATGGPSFVTEET